MATKEIEEYTHTEIKEKGVIRIAHLLPGDGDGSIYIEISTKRLNDPLPKYNAVSWQWGGQNEDPVIRIRNRPTCKPEANSQRVNNQGTNNQGANNQGPNGQGQKSTIWKSMRVKQNLLDALKRLRSPDDEVRLWVDAICIMQVQERGNSNSEKSQQISMMTDIYKNATQVKVWLGEPKLNAKDRATENGINSNITSNDITQEDVKKAVQYIDMLVNLDDTNHIAGVDQGILDKAGMHELEPLFKLFRCGWFSRRWIVQEISVNRNVEVHCGGESVSWEKLAYAVALLERVGRDGTINRMLQKRRETLHVAEYVGNISALPAYRLVQNKHTLSRMRGEVEVMEQTLEQLVCFLAVFQASYAHDTIYAIIGIASDFKPVTKPDNQNASGQNINNPSANNNQAINDQSNAGGSPGGLTDDAKEDFVVDYQQEPVQVFKRFLKSAITKSRSLDILCRPWAPIYNRNENNQEERIELPSWMPSIERKPFQTTKGGRMIRYNPDPLVGAAVFRLKFYSASGLQNPHLQEFFDIDVANGSNHIIVHAFELSKIGRVWNSATFGNIPRSWLDAAGWTDGRQQPSDELWRTLVADRTVEGNKADPWYPMAFQSAAREKGIRYGINTAELIHEKNNAAYSEVFRRVQAVVWNRRLIRTETITSRRDNKEWKHLGLAPEDAQVGDSIFIVLGCSVPLVLRLADTSNGGTSAGPNSQQQGSGQTYTLVGDCYVDDMMDGQALTHVGSDWKKIKIE